MFTSVIVFGVTAGRFHGGVTACSSPAQLAHAIPAVITQRAPAVAVTQTRATLCAHTSTMTMLMLENPD